MGTRGEWKSVVVCALLPGAQKATSLAAPDEALVIGLSKKKMKTFIPD